VGCVHGTYPSSEALVLTGSYGSLDVEIHHLEKAQQLKFASVKVVASGPLLAAVETEVKYGKSTINVTVSCQLLPPGVYPLT
jgi:hypothetical protein